MELSFYISLDVVLSFCVSNAIWYQSILSFFFFFAQIHYNVSMRIKHLQVGVLSKWHLTGWTLGFWHNATTRGKVYYHSLAAPSAIYTHKTYVHCWPMNISTGVWPIYTNLLEQVNSWRQQLVCNYISPHTPVLLLLQHTTAIVLYWENSVTIPEVSLFVKQSCQCSVH